MRVLHFSDLHIGVENYGRTDPVTGLSTRLLDFLSTFDELVDYALDNNVDLVLFSGDAYKGRDPSQTQQREFAKRLARLSSEGIPTFLVVGNHDLPHALGRANALEIFNVLDVPKVYVGNELRTYIVPTPKGPIQIVALPWPRRSSLLNREESKGKTIDQIRQRIEELISNGIVDQISRLDSDIPAILAGHVTVNGAITSTERSMMLGNDHSLLASTIHRPELDYIALGHVHRHQILRENPMVVYSGSLQRVDFSEENDTKGFCVIDLDPTESPGNRMKNFTFQQVKARPFLTIDVKIEPNDPDPTQTVIDAISRRHVTESIVRLKIQLPSELTTQLMNSSIRKALGEAHFIASISRIVDEDRRTRISGDIIDKIGTLDALSLHLDSRQVSQTRKDSLLTHAEQLISAEMEEHINE